jgi:hypothetical protein
MIAIKKYFHMLIKVLKHNITKMKMMLMLLIVLIFNKKTT